MTKYTKENLDQLLRKNILFAFPSEYGDSTNFWFVLKDYLFYLYIQITVFENKNKLDIRYTECLREEDIDEVYETDFLERDEKEINIKFSSVRHPFLQKLIKIHMGL